jgi:hypothetical protein
MVFILARGETQPPHALSERCNGLAGVLEQEHARRPGEGVAALRRVLRPLEAERDDRVAGCAPRDPE